MKGVVLWSNKADHKAVVWCEDHGDLAYLETSKTPAKCQLSLNVGDMVEFKVKLRGTLRCGYDARLVEPQVCHGLPDSLRALGAASSQPEDTDGKGEVVTFPRKAANDAPSRQARNG